MSFGALGNARMSVANHNHIEKTNTHHHTNSANTGYEYQVSKKDKFSRKSSIATKSGSFSRDIENTSASTRNYYSSHSNLYMNDNYSNNYVSSVTFVPANHRRGSSSASLNHYWNNSNT